MKKLADIAMLCIYHALLFSPVALLMGALLPGANQAAAGIYYAAGQLLALIVGMIPPRGRVAAMLLVGAAYAGAGLWCLDAISAPFTALIILFSLVIYFVTVRMERSDYAYDSRLMILGFVLNAAAPLVIKLSRMEVDYTIMMWCGLAFMMLSPFIMNSKSVRAGMSLRGRGGRTIKRISGANRAMVAVLLAIVLAIANARTLKEAFQRAGSFLMYWLGQAIMCLMNLFAGHDSMGGTGGAGNGEMGLPALESAEPSWFALLMEKIIRYIALLILLALLAFALYKLGKMLVQLSKKLMAWARRFASGVKEDYLDECEQLMDWGEVRGEMLDAVRNMFKNIKTHEKKWSELDARGRVRYVMRQLYRKKGGGISGIECMSARQALAEMEIDASRAQELGDIYDRARYSDHAITDADAEAARRSAEV